MSICLDAQEKKEIFTIDIYPKCSKFLEKGNDVLEFYFRKFSSRINSRNG